MSEETFILPMETVVEVITKRILGNAPELRRGFRLRRTQATSLADELLAVRRVELPIRLRKSRGRFHSRPLVELLTKRCGELTQVDAEAAERAAEAALAVLVAVVKGLAKEQRLWLEFSGLAGWHDLRGLVLAQLANVHRAQCRWEDSHQGFRRAYTEIGEGTGDPIAAARVRCLHASLLRDRGAHEQALECLAQTALSYRSLGHDHELGLALLKRADILDLSHKSANAIGVQIEAISLLEEAQDPVATLAAFANLAQMYRRGGQTEAALFVLESSESYLEDLPADCRARTTWHWIRGRVNLALRRDQEAEDDLKQAYSGFQRAEHPYDFGLVGLDLMKLYRFQNRLRDLFEVAEPTLSALQEQELSPEALEAVLMLTQELGRNSVEMSLIEQVAETLNFSFDPRNR